MLILKYSLFLSCIPSVRSDTFRRVGFLCVLNWLKASKFLGQLTEVELQMKLCPVQIVRYKIRVCTHTYRRHGKATWSLTPALRLKCIPKIAGNQTREAWKKYVNDKKAKKQKTNKNQNIYAHYKSFKCIQNERFVSSEAVIYIAPHFFPTSTA